MMCPLENIVVCGSFAVARAVYSLFSPLSRFFFQYYIINSYASQMMHRLTAIWCICFANMMLLHFVPQWCDVCPKMWRSHASLGEAVIIGGANIICRRQTSFKKRTFVGRQKCVFCWLRRWDLNLTTSGLWGAILMLLLRSMSLTGQVL